MTIFNQGNANPSAFGVPGLYINVQAPPSATLPGAPSDVLGIVGVASWGPVNSPVAVSDEAGMAAAFGPMVNRKYDLATVVHAAALQGARNFRLIRATDGSDTAASAVIQTSGFTATAKYTGSLGAGISVTISAGTKDSTKKVTVTMPGRPPEVFDNIVATAASNASWVAIAAAINNGTTQRGPSQLIVATAGASTAAPTNNTTALTGGADGASTATTTTLIGADTGTRTGMYALRGTGIAVFVLADGDDTTSFATQIAFAKSESAFGYGVTPSGDTLSSLATEMVGTDDPWFKVLFGDWVYMLDNVNNLVRIVSPQGFTAGSKVVIGPQNSGLNKPLYGVVGTQKSALSQQYSPAELQVIAGLRADVIVMASPGGDYPSLAFGRNTSSDIARRQETYTTMTNYLARSLDQKAGIGLFIGRLITPDETREAKNTIESFLHAEWDAGRIGNSLGTVPYSVAIDNSAQLQGVQKAVVKAQYLSVIEYFVVDLTGGTTVQINPQTALAA